MQISQETLEQLNVLMAGYFDFNAFLDNCAYDLGFNLFPNIEKIVHEKFAHKMPEFADDIFEIIDNFGGRAKRKTIGAYEKEYGSDLTVLFEEVSKKSKELYDQINKTIEIAELNEETGVVVALHDFLEDYIPYDKQFEDLAVIAARYRGSEVTFDVHFDKYVKL